jgi:ABC-type lipoprotein export system ATPase subunit
VLSARGLTFGYDPAAPVVEAWSHTFEAGEMVAITGPSGRGKSTLLYLLGLMLSPGDGDVLVDGEVVSRLSDARRARLRAQSFGFVFQDAALDTTRTVLDNVLETSLYRATPRAAEARRARDLLAELGVELTTTATPGQVSGGQAQRIALCRALLNDPRVLLADEPTGNLDRASAGAVLAALRAQAGRGAAVIVVTHDDEVVAHCDRWVTL